MRHRDRHRGKAGTHTRESPARTSVAEELLIDVLPELAGDRVACTTLGQAQFALACATRLTATQVVCQFFDLHFATEAHGRWINPPSNLELRCEPDLPLADSFDVVALPLRTEGEAEFARDLIQQGHQALRIGGRMAVAAKNPRDTWLNDELRKLFAKVTRRPTSEGVVYLATKTEPLRKLKNFDCEFAFRDGQRLIRLVSRPGVFSHRELDGGARTLIKAMDIRAGMRVLDIGCGSGAVGIAAALRTENVNVVCIDSHTRAIECTARGAALNGVAGLTTMLSADGNVADPASFDLALGNPPYFGDHAIAELFLQSAHRALKPSGHILIVTKSPAWYVTRMPELFLDVQVHASKEFAVVEGIRE
jgi:16S rRNA (guanine1207-N2)-methyltransferase